MFKITKKLLWTTLTLSLMTLIYLLSSPTQLLAQGHNETIKIGINQDTYAESEYAGAKPWDNRNFYVGFDMFYNKRRTRPYLKYSLTPVLEKEIPPKKITNATLFLYQYIAETNLSYDVDLFEIRSPWQQYTLDWNHQPNTRHISTHTISPSDSWKQLDITELFKSQIVNPTDSYGISLRNVNEYAPGGIFWSISCHLAPTAPQCTSEQPYILITYDTNQLPEKTTLNSPINGYLTADTDVVFSWKEGYDPDGDEISYKLVVSSEPDLSVVVNESEWLTTTEYTTSLENDGTYYWGVLTKDEYCETEEAILSNVRHLEIDRTPPAVPFMTQEPPFTYGGKNSVHWDFDESSENHIVSFTVQASPTDNFTDELDATGDVVESVRTVMTNELGVTFSDLNERIYYYRVKATDKLGNTSDWSSITSTYQDFSEPVVTSLTTSQRFISPNYSPGTQDTTQIRFEITEHSILEWKLVFEDLERNIVHTISGDEKSFQTTWGPKDFPDGVYFIYLKVIDQVGLEGKSNVIGVQIDNTPPDKPIITAPRNGELTNLKKVDINVSAGQLCTHTLEINGHAISTFENSLFSYLLNRGRTDGFREGKNTISVTSTDRAGNQSSSSVSFLTDWTAPTPPNVLLIYYTKQKMLKLKVQSKDFKTAYIYNPAGLHKTIQANQNPTVVVDNWIGETTYSFYARLQDKAGNLSQAGKQSHYKTPGREILGIGTSQRNINDTKDFSSLPKPLRHACLFKYNTSTKILKETKCWSSRPRLDKVEHFTADKNLYQIHARGNHNQNLKLKIAKYKCKKRTFWDPETWFRCKEVYIGTTTNTVHTGGDMIGLVQDKNSTKLRMTRRSTDESDNFQVDFFKRKDFSGESFEVKAEIFGSYKVAAGKWIDLHKYSGRSRALKIPKYTFTAISSGRNKPFRFPFDKIIGVTQWYGETAYQSPHNGIDFGAYKEPIYAVADGYISKAGWNGKKGSCKNGGRFLLIAHDNGMYSGYAHLSNFKKSKGGDWKKGQRVKRGDLIGYTGNSGKYNCKTIGYHLHWEIRKKKAWSSHTDPVPLTDIDWSKVKTLGIRSNPGRLSGNNPHPKY